MQPGVWFVLCGFTSVFALLRKLELEMAARLKVGDNKAGRIFRSLYKSNKGSFERDVHLALKDWLILGLWDTLDTKTLSTFKNKTLKISKKCWPQGLQTGVIWRGFIITIWFFRVMFRNGRIGIGVIEGIRICSSYTFTTF